MTYKGNKKLTQEQCIEKFKLIHGDTYDYSKVKYTKSSEKVIIICRKHKEEFLKTARSHWAGSICPKCSIKKKGSTVKRDLETFIELANEVHNNKYNYSESIYVNSHTKLKIKCKNNHIFEQKPVNHLSGAGCYYCNGGIKKTQDEFIKKAKEIHNDKYIYSKVNYINNFTEVEIYCYSHGYFKQSPAVHLRGHGCKKCGNESSSKKQSLGLAEFIEKAILIHSEKYDYSITNYINNRILIDIKCLNHNEIFRQTPNSHLNGHGCPKCGVEQCSRNLTLPQEKFLEHCNIIHNNKYNYDKTIYSGGDNKIIITCPIHFDFEQRAEHHRYGGQCPECLNSSHVSNMENKWLNYIEIRYNIKILRQVYFKELKIFADGFHKESNTIYEFHGDYWHGNPKKFDPNDLNKKLDETYGYLYNKTLDKENRIIKAGYNLISIWEYDFKRSSEFSDI